MKGKLLVHTTCKKSAPNIVGCRRRAAASEFHKKILEFDEAVVFLVFACDSTAIGNPETERREIGTDQRVTDVERLVGLCEADS